MKQTLILLAHPRYEASRANRALVDAAHLLGETEVADLYQLYPDGQVDIEAEAARLLRAERIVLQFPVQWYSTPPLLKEWQDRVLTQMFYVDFANQGAHLAGKPLMVSATAGNVPAAYAQGGANLFTMEELLRPLQATAHRCGLNWLQPFVLFEAMRASEAVLQAGAERYLQHARRQFGSVLGEPLAA